uniref:ATP synthase subunit d, mitochondrial n=1 Tax=Trichuris muris TaxID=70415 RepID=A0A5S6QG90_TRIMR
MVMEHDRQQFEAFRSLCLEPLHSIVAMPEKLPEIDWNYYKEKTAGFYNIAELETRYKALNITPAKQPDHLLKQIDEAEKADTARLGKFLAANEAVIKVCQNELDRWAKVPPVDHWLPEEFEQYVPNSNEELIDYIRYEDPVEQYMDLGYRRVRCMKEEDGDFNGELKDLHAILSLKEVRVSIRGCCCSLYRRLRKKLFANDVAQLKNECPANNRATELPRFTSHVVSQFVFPFMAKQRPVGARLQGQNRLTFRSTLFLASDGEQK